MIRVSLLADASKMKSGLADADRAVATTEKSMSDFGKAAVASFGVVAVGAVVSFAKDSVKAFSDVEQSAGAVESVFGTSADSIISKSDEAAEAFGLSASEFQTSAALIGSMLKNQMGLSAEDAAGKVDDLTGKAADMAATFGGTTSDAINAIGSLLRGERDPIEKYGVSMNDAAITARALELGLADARGEITPTAKATAALDILNEQTADSTGQFARESDTLAGSQQILAANIENTKAKIGELLAPAVADVTGTFSDLVGITDILLDKLDQVKDDGAPGVADAGIALIPIVGQVYTGFQNFQNAAKGLYDQLSGDTTPAMVSAAGAAGITSSAMDYLQGSTEDVTAAEEDLTGAIRDTITIRQEAHDQIRGQQDAFFALVDATNAQADAQATLNTLEGNGVTGGLAYEEAVRDVAEASLAVEDAQMRLLTSGGLTREEFETQRVKMGLTADQAQVLIDKYDILFTPRTVTHTTTIQYNERTAQTRGRQHGGPVTKGSPYVVGEAGPELFVPNTSGQIKPASANGHASGGGVVNLHIHADRSQALDGWKIIEALQQVERRNGPLPISVRT